MREELKSLCFGGMSVLIGAMPSKQKLIMKYIEDK